MENFHFINLLPRHVAVNYLKLKSYTRKIQRTSSSIGFTRKSVHNNIVPTFAKVKGQFIDSKDQIKAEKGTSKSHLLNHKKNLQYFRTVINIYQVQYFNNLVLTIQKH